MLNCEQCNYIRTREQSEPKSIKYVCNFTGFVFNKEISDYDMNEHPCYCYSYDQYAEDVKNMENEGNKKVRIA